MLELVIFDLDGVLVDACEIHRVSLNEALKEICNYEIPLQEHYEHFNGIPTKVKLKKLFDRGLIKKEHIEKVETLKQIKTINTINDTVFEKQDKIDLFNFLKSKNIKIACYTNSIRQTAELMLSRSNLLNNIDILVTNQDVINPKPDPEGYLSILKKLNIHPDNTIIVEDSDKGFQAAILSGCMCIKVANQEDVNLNIFKEYFK